MSIKGVRIEKGKTFWYVSKKNSNNNQGYVEIGKFIIFDAAIEFAKKTVDDEQKGLKK